MHPPIYPLIKDKGDRDPLSGTEANDAYRYVILINFQKHLKTISVVGDSAHREKEMRPIAQIFISHCGHNIVGIEPTATIAPEPKALAVAGSGAGVP